LNLINSFLDCASKNGWVIVVTNTVNGEINNPIELKVLIEKKVSEREIILENNYDQDALLIRFPSLGPGEASILSLVEEMRHVSSEIVLIFDDKKARSTANNNGYKTIGTVGIIKALIKRGYITAEKIEWIKEKLPSILYCSQKLIEKINGDC
jgi:predicted nucleic acid-binding protein